MRGVGLLIRLAQHELEERRSDLGAVTRARLDTETAIDTLGETVASETRIALGDPSVIAAYGTWAGHSARGRAQLQDRVEELDVSEGAARDNLRESAARVRRLEIVFDTARAETRKRDARRAETRADDRELIRFASRATD